MENDLELLRALDSLSPEEKVAIIEKAKRKQMATSQAPSRVQSAVVYGEGEY